MTTRSDRLSATLDVTAGARFSTVFTVPAGRVVILKSVVCNNGPGATTLNTVTVQTPGGVPALVTSLAGANVNLERQVWVVLEAGDTIVWNRTIPAGGYVTCWLSGASLVA